MTGETANRGFAISERRDERRAFRLAARHSRRVRMLRVALPVTIVLALGVTALVSWLDPLKVLVRLPIDSGKLVISGSKITMEAPKLMYPTVATAIAITRTVKVNSSRDLKRATRSSNHGTKRAPTNAITAPRAAS